MNHNNPNAPPTHSLSAEEIAQFHRQGFLGPFVAFTPEEMAAFRPLICDQILKTPSPHSAYRTELRHLDSRLVWRLCSERAIVDRLASLYGPDLIVWYSNLFDKGAERLELEGAYPWHQDTLPFQEKPLTTLSAWLAITPATVENGCVELIPGTHTSDVPVIQKSDAGHADWFSGRAADPSCFNEAGKVAMVLKPGEFFLFDGKTLHHSNPNRTQQRRIGLSFRVAAPSVKLGLPHPCLVVSGQDRSALNPLAKPPTNDPSLLQSPSLLADCRDYAFDQPLHGLGWHLLEQDDETWFRWTGPEKDSWIDLRSPARGDSVLRCQVLHALTPVILQSLQVRVNDHPLPLQWSQNGRCVQVEGRVPGSVLAAGGERVRVSLHVGETLRPCDLQPGNMDTRRLGLAISRVGLKPVVGAVKPPAWKRIFGLLNPRAALAAEPELQ